MQNIIIDEEFKYLLPALDEISYRDLEDGILKFGCLIPLVLWGGILIDGHHRYKICTEYNISFETIDMEFDSREEVKVWIIENQISRRNLNPMQLSYFRGTHYKADKSMYGSSRRFSESASNALNTPSSQNGNLGVGSTATRLSEKYKVSKNTIMRDEKLADAIDKIGVTSPEAKGKILSGEIQINKNKLSELLTAPAQYIEEITKKIEEGTYNRRPPRVTGDLESGESGNSAGHGSSSDNESPETSTAYQTDEIRQLGYIINDFAKNFEALLRDINEGGSPMLQPVLRSYIDRLEELYQSMNIL